MKNDLVKAYSPAATSISTVLLLMKCLVPLTSLYGILGETFTVCRPICLHHSLSITDIVAAVSIRAGTGNMFNS